MKNTLHINLFGGPGTGKSTIAAELFSKLKWNKMDSELISEYAKQIVWEESFSKLSNQIYLFAKQHKRHIILNGKVDYVVTDSPLIMGTVYDKNDTKHLQELIFSEFNKFENLNIFLIRDKEYNPNGRTQTYDEAIQKDNEIFKLLNENNVNYYSFVANETAVNLIFDLIKIKI